MKLKIILIFFIFLFTLSSFNVTAQDSNVLVVEVTGTIDQSTVEFLTEAIQEAKEQDSQAIIILLDTPGGGLQQTFDIADTIQNTSVPIIGYVHPTGSSAASAGTFILMSTHVAAMTEHTIIGSCQPVRVGIEGTKLVNDSKTINFLKAWIRARANMYNRNETIAERFITENLNLNATLAKKYGVIEYVSSSIHQLLEDIDGINVTTSAGNVTLHTKNAKQIRYSPSLKIQFLKIISNPTITSLLLMLGIFALLFGISSPGFGAEVFGVIAILLSLVGSGFAISALSIIFIIIGCLLLVTEIFVIPGFGVTGIGGIICLVIGAIFLVPNYSPPTTEWLISMEWINNLIIIMIVAGALIAAFFAFLLYKILKIRKKKTAVGIFAGEKAITIDQITPDKPGYVRFKGEYWQAKSNTTIEANTKVIILSKDESVLIVKPVKSREK
ncbi:MAG: NfeD family protein [Petrotogales bacterium]